MRRFFLGVGIFLMLLGICGMSYTWHHDHREVSTLEEYATLDFKTARDEFGNLEGANLTLWDYRYDRAQLLAKAVLLVDGVPWELEAATRQTPSNLLNENKLFVSVPAAALKDVLAAREVRVKFFYDNEQAVDLPLGPKELILWQRKLRW